MFLPRGSKHLTAARCTLKLVLKNDKGTTQFMWKQSLLNESIKQSLEALNWLWVRQVTLYRPRGRNTSHTRGTAIPVCFR